MAYRDPTFNANMLTDLLDTYLTNQSKERERYFQVAQQQDKPMIRQGADGYLYYDENADQESKHRIRIRRRWLFPHWHVRAQPVESEGGECLRQ